ncbi:hypothetical protein ALQ04_04488, partial [Pseudomonas cichorii]
MRWFQCSMVVKKFGSRCVREHVPANGHVIEVGALCVRRKLSVRVVFTSPQPASSQIAW